jgi:hypothetical protein
MNLFLRPLEDVNDVTWSIIWCLIILLAGVSYYIYTIIALAYEELKESEKSKESSSLPDRSTDSNAVHDHASDYQISDDGEFF